jgi:hypothetical protein
VHDQLALGTADELAVGALDALTSEPNPNELDSDEADDNAPYSWQTCVSSRASGRALRRGVGDMLVPSQTTRDAKRHAGGERTLCPRAVTPSVIRAANVLSVRAW